MNVLFLTTGRLDNIEEHGIYPDLLRTFRDHGHNVYSVSTYERRTGRETQLKFEAGVHTLRVRVGNITKCNVIEKGISTLLIERQFKQAIKRYYSEIKFDLVLYSTPPITLVNTIKYIKERDQAKSYLLLKDIFPQNAVDLGMLSTSGIKGLIYRYFRWKEMNLYLISDKIGCMSQANVDFVLKQNLEILPNKVEVCPNCIDIQDYSLTKEEKELMRKKYGIPHDKKVFVYGGNLGKPQGIPFLIDCLKTQEQNRNVFFLIVGDGTEFSKLKAYVDSVQPNNVGLMNRLPKEDYDRMIAACDVGMIFLDYRFTIPNFPSRMLSYMQAGIPILACTDANTDIGTVIEDGEFGWWCESNNAKIFAQKVESIIRIDNLEKFSNNSTRYLVNNYNVEKGYRVILNSIL